MLACLALLNRYLFRDAANGASTVNDTATFNYMKNTFTAHYTGQRQPIGLYTHPIHLSVCAHFLAAAILFSQPVCLDYLPWCQPAQ